MNSLPSTPPNPLATQVIRRRRLRRLQQRESNSRQAVGLGGTILVALVIMVVVVVVGTIGTAVGIYYFYARTLPPPGEIVKVREQFETTRLYDRTGQTVLYEVVDPNGDRQSVPISAIPADLINATIAIEDKSFYTNAGFDVRGILRAVFIALQEGAVQGGSTITQQLVKNTLIPPAERTNLTRDRKIKEIILAAEISRLYSKDQIMEWYLNTNFYGNLAYGVSAAAKVYFGKSLSELTLGESAMLSAIPQNPQYNPIDNPTQARQRQAIVLQYMVGAGYITADQMTKALSEPIVTQSQTDRYNIIAPHFSIWARDQAEELLNQEGLDGGRLVLGGGLKIYTTLDLDLQYQVECVNRAYVIRAAGGGATATPNTSNGQPCTAAQFLPNPPDFDLNTQRNVSNAASVVIKPDTGEVLAMTGSLDYFNVGIGGNFNAAVQGLRQPASTFKPFVYVTAFSSPENPYTPATMVLDVPTTFNSAGTLYTPRNEDNQFHGPMSVRKALANSYNIPAVRVLSDVSAQRVIRVARQLGLSSLQAPPEKTGLALALGSSEVSLLDLTYAYSVFANLGIMAGQPDPNPRPGFRTYNPSGILRIEDKDGNTLWEYAEAAKTFGRGNVLRDALAYLINDILSDNQARLDAFGVGNALQLSFPAAVKTGTTNDNRDAWTVGYTPHLVAGVWVGNNDNTSMGSDLSGGTGAAPIWHAIMEYYRVRDSVPADTWTRPSTIAEATVCAISGLLPTAACDGVKEIFKDAQTSTIPTQPDIYWKLLKVNAKNGLIATSSTPSELVADRQYFDYPAEAIEWAKSKGLPIAPTEYDSANAARTDKSGAITSPNALARVRGVLELRGILDTKKVASYNLEYGAGINPAQWVSIGGGDPKGRGADVLLGNWNTSGLDGLYTLRLGLILKNGSFEPNTIQVTVDNQPPTVTLVAPITNSRVSQSAGTIRLEADATDNFEIVAVEFYSDGKLIKRVDSGVGTFATDWTIDSTGLKKFSAVAFDSAGNQTTSETIIVTVE